MIYTDHSILSEFVFWQFFNFPTLTTHALSMTLFFPLKIPIRQSPNPTPLIPDSTPLVPDSTPLIPDPTPLIPDLITVGRRISIF